jgi:hypothetical protein
MPTRGISWLLECSGDGSPTDKLNAHGLAMLVVNELDFPQFHQNRFAIAHLELHLAGAADGLPGGTP